MSVTDTWRPKRWADYSLPQSACTCHNATTLRRYNARGTCELTIIATCHSPRLARHPVNSLHLVVDHNAAMFLCNDAWPGVRVACSTGIELAQMQQRAPCVLARARVCVCVCGGGGHGKAHLARRPANTFHALLPLFIRQRRQRQYCARMHTGSGLWVHRAWLWAVYVKCTDLVPLTELLFGMRWRICIIRRTWRLAFSVCIPPTGHRQGTQPRQGGEWVPITHE